jgi:hypothetical protein
VKGAKGRKKRVQHGYGMFSGGREGKTSRRMAWSVAARNGGSETLGHCPGMWQGALSGEGRICGFQDKVACMMLTHPMWRRSSTLSCVSAAQMFLFTVR